MRLAYLALIAMTFVPAQVTAHPEGHDVQERVQPRPVAEIAKASIVKLVTQAKLPASWSQAQLIGNRTRTRNGVDQLVITFENRAIRKQSKRRLYVLMTPGGEFISANHKLT